MKKIIIATLMLISSYCYADTYKYIFNPMTGHLDKVNVTISSAAYATNSDKLDGYDSSFFLSTNTVISNTQYFISKATSSLDMNNYPIYDAATISIATNSASGYLQIKDNYILVAATTSKTIQEIINQYGNNITYEFLATTISVNSQINIFKNNITIKGQSTGTIFQAEPWANWTAAGHMFYSSGTSGLTLDNFKVTCGTNTGRALDTVLVMKSAHVTLQNLWCDNSDRNGIRVDGSNFVFIDHCKFTNCDNESIWFEGYDNISGTYTGGYQTIITNNIIKGGGALSVIYARNVLVANNMMWNLSDSGIKCAQLNYGISILNNSVNAGTGGGIYIEGTAANGFQISGNSITDCVGVGIELGAVVYAGAITNNTIAGTASTYPGLWIGQYGACRGLNIIGNSIVNPGNGRGAIAFENCSYSLVANNNCTNTTTGKSEWGFKVVLGTGNVVMNNIFGLQDTSDIQVESTARNNVFLNNVCNDSIKFTEVNAALSNSIVNIYQDNKWGFGVSSPTVQVDVAIDARTPLLYVSTITARDNSGVWIGTSSVNGTRFEYDGTMVNVGSATTWDDLQVTLNPATAVYAPTYADYKAGRVIVFSDEPTNEDKIHFVAQLPHRYKIGSNIEPHVHWVGEDNSAGTIAWKIDYTTAAPNQVFATTQSSTTYVANPSTTDLHSYTDIGSIPGDLGISGIIVGTISRNSTNALDTYNGKDVYLLQFDLHFETDMTGSRTEWVK